MWYHGKLNLLITECRRWSWSPPHQPGKATRHSYVLVMVLYPGTWAWLNQHDLKNNSIDHWNSPLSVKHKIQGQICNMLFVKASWDVLLYYIFNQWLNSSDCTLAVWSFLHYMCIKYQVGLYGMLALLSAIGTNKSWRQQSPVRCTQIFKIKIPQKLGEKSCRFCMIMDSLKKILANVMDRINCWSYQNLNTDCRSDFSAEMIFQNIRNFIPDWFRTYFQLHQENDKNCQ